MPDAPRGTGTTGAASDSPDAPAVRVDFAFKRELDMPDIFSIGDLIESRLENVERVVIPDAAHMVNMEKPEEFNRIVLDFLERTLPR